MNKIVLTLGEPAGIGPDITLLLWKDNPTLFSTIIVIGNEKLLQERAELLKIDCDAKNHFSIIDVPLHAPVIPGKLNSRNSNYVIQCLKIAANGCLQNQFSAMVTGPVHKGVINDAGTPFSGQTDFLSKLTSISQTVMMLMTSHLKVALLTDHIPLCRVAEQVTRDRLKTAIQIIVHDFQMRFRISHPRILICGVNPHAGEQGYLGTEEKNILIPVINEIRQDHFSLMGPIGADVAFTEHMRNQCDVILAMYHDQGLPVIKYAGFHEAVNVTLGLPFVRTSVDHGTALDIAGTGKADYHSLFNAILLAQQLTRER